MRPEIGQVADGYITAWTPFGVFVELKGAEEYKSLLHISEMPGLTGYMPDDDFRVGDCITALRVTEVDEIGRRITLSLRPLLSETDN